MTVNPFWLTLFPSPDGVTCALRDFLQFNRGSASTAVIWNSLKAFLRGCLIREITGIKNHSREWENRVQDEMRTREQALVADPSQSNHDSWTEAQSLYNSVLLSAAEKRRYFLQQGCFEEGENTGHLLALVAREQRDSTNILAIRAETGERHTLNSDVLNDFYRFYNDLYTSKTIYAPSDLALFLQTCPFSPAF